MARRDVLERDGWKCVACGTQTRLTVDHIVPKSQGGGNELANLQTLCRPCHDRKDNMVPRKDPTKPVRRRKVKPQRVCNWHPPVVMRNGRNEVLISGRWEPVYWDPIVNGWFY